MTSSNPRTYEFDASDADVILTPDNCEDSLVKFRVHKIILTTSSRFFDDLFTLPQKDSSKNDIPVIAMSEPASILDALLRLAYPVPDPHIETLDDLIPVLEAANKYDFLEVICNLRKMLISPRFLDPDPVRVFCIACRYDLKEEALAASRHTLRIDVLNYPLCDDLKHISAHSYHRLINLHRRRSSAAQELLKLPYDVKCPQCNGVGHCIYNAPKWWYEFLKRAKAELSARPTTSVIFTISFLAEAAVATGCMRCPGSMLESLKYLESIKKQIDALPCELEIDEEPQGEIETTPHEV
ncbi:hypothetical protein D9758_005915 [Tetrapyrgos nigripes]|uniref:BTB domain-containing protein n=1 Tax=Tetrapyrgos nigripes TaxID=182062 RepID=A0A8H5EZD6_9AGAR|nr:hypothetical protein D9758_018223 [Tetrapyrgos nigripes]KAF5357283.1 hypothetical protein D9758_005915 [Tetrapyrgos nigripes]